MTHYWWCMRHARHTADDDDNHSLPEWKCKQDDKRATDRRIPIANWSIDRSGELTTNWRILKFFMNKDDSGYVRCRRVERITHTCVWQQNYRHVVPGIREANLYFWKGPLPSVIHMRLGIEHEPTAEVRGKLGEEHGWWLGQLVESRETALTRCLLPGPILIR